MEGAGDGAATGSSLVVGAEGVRNRVSCSGLFPAVVVGGVGERGDSGSALSTLAVSVLSACVAVFTIEEGAGVT